MWKFPKSRPNILSSSFDIGQANGKSRKMKHLTIHIVCAPIARPCREHAAWGAISPKITIAKVEVTNPMGPSVKSANKIAINALTYIETL